MAVWIYSFHMALFMMLSGMFLSSSLKKTFKVMTFFKTRQLILPVITWSLVYLFLNELLITPVNQWNSEIISFIKGAGFLHGLWFLKCLFFYYIICWLSLRYLKKEWLAVSVTMIVVLLLPDVNFSSKMLPFFWAGYFFMKYRSFIEEHQYKEVLPY